MQAGTRWVGGALLLGLGAAILAPSCRDSTAPTPPAVEPLAPHVTLERCAERTADDGCFIPRDGRLVVTATPAAALTFTVDGVVSTASVALGEHVVRVAEDARALAVSWRGREVLRAPLSPPSRWALPALLLDLREPADQRARAAAELPTLLPGPRATLEAWQRGEVPAPTPWRSPDGRWTLTGCAALLSGGRCVLPADGRVTVEGDPSGARLAGPWGERTWEAGEHRVDARAREVRWADGRLELLPPDPAEGALRARTAPERVGELLPGPRARAHFELGRLARGKERPDDAEVELRSAVEDAEAAGLTSLAVRARLLSSFLLAERWKLDEARAALDAVPSLADRWIEGELLRLFHLGSMQRAALQRAQALAAFEGAGAQARRIARALALDRSTLLRDPAHMAAVTAMSLGRAVEARRALDALALGPDARCDERVDLETNRAWVASMELMSARPVDRAAARGHFTAALDAVRGCPHKSPRDVARLQLDLALFEALDGRYDAATRWATTARAAVAADDDELRASALHVEQVCALGHGEWARAEAAAKALIDIGRARAHRRVEWTGLLGLGEVKEARGALDAAARAYADAERLATEDALLMPIDRGLLAFLSTSEASAARWVSLELRRGRAAAALDVARRASRRALASATAPDLFTRTPGARASIERYQAARAELRRWDVRTPRGRRALGETEAALQSLRALLGSTRIDEAALYVPARGERLVTWFPGADGWVGWVASDEGPHAVTLGPPPVARTVEAVSAWALAPLAAQLAGADKIRLQPYGWMASVDLHASPALPADVAVVYGLDVPARARTSSASAILAVGVSDADAPLIDDELAGVVRALGSTTQLLRGPAARSEAFLGALGRTRHLHFAGHGRFAGRDGTDSRIELDDGPVSAGDLLLLPAVPETVVLSSCETARPADDGQGFGVAQALVVAGALRVLAPTRRVPDALARDAALALYAERGPDAWARALRRAMAHAPGQDWAAYRVLEP